MTKKMITEMLDEMERFGTLYIGSKYIQGVEAVCNRYNKLRKAYEKKNPGYTLAFDIENGTVWAI